MHISTNTYEYSRYNLQWNGTSIFFGSMDTAGYVEISDSRELTNRDSSILLIIAPEQPFNNEESSDILDFIETGNVIFIADEEGSANSLLQGLGSEIRVIPANVTSIDRHFDDASSVVAHPSAPDHFSSGIDHLILNRPSYASGGTAIYTTSLLTWIDTDGDGRIGETEELGRYSVLCREYIGNGTIYVLTDPSLFINGMQAGGIGKENQAFISKILHTDHVTLMVEQDHSRTASADAVVRGIAFMKSSNLIKALMIVVIGAFASLIAWKRSMESS